MDGLNLLNSSLVARLCPCVFKGLSTGMVQAGKTGAVPLERTGCGLGDCVFLGFGRASNAGFAVRACLTGAGLDSGSDPSASANLSAAVHPPRHDNASTTKKPDTFIN